MSYERVSASKSETTVYRGRLHWIGYVPALAMALAAAISSFYLGILAILFMIAAVVLLAHHLIALWTTEILVTTRRVVFKRGLIRRQTIEISASKVEGVDVDQSIPGRILGYGDLTIRGTGIGNIGLKGIAEPVEARRALDIG